MSALSPLAEQTTGAIHVLHVDDEPDLADVTATFLERNDGRFEVATATSAAEGLERLAETDVDCIISDYDMPGTNGIEFLETVREDYPDLPFILFTGKGSEEVASDAISAGVTDYLQKETGSDQYAVLANRVSNAVDRYRSQHMVEQSERRLRDIIDAVPHILYVVDADGTYLLANEAQAEFHNTTTDAIEGAHVSDILGEAAGEQFMGDLRDVLDAGAGRRLTEVELEDADGETHIFEPRLLPYDLGNGNREAVLGIAVDITDRQQRARELERYEACLEESTDIITVLDESGTIEYESPAVSRVLGYDPGDLLGEVGFDYVHPDDREEMVEAFSDLVAEPGETITVQCRFRTADEEWRWLEVRGTNQLDHDAIEGVVTNNRDITARKQHEQELERTTSMLSTLIETLPVGVLAADGSRNILAVNERLLDLFEMPGEPDEIVGRNGAQMAEEVSDMFVDPERFVERIEELIATRETAHNEALELTDGRTFVRTHQPIELPGGSGNLWVYRDVTEQQTRERQLQETTSRLEALFEQSPDMINTHDADGNIIDPNPRLIEKTGYGEAELTDMKVWDIDQTLEPDTASDIWAGMAAGDRDRAEGVFERRDGSTFPVEVHLRRLALDDEERFMVISRDITERKRKETNLHRQRDRLEQFASIVSHDLRNPLNVASTRLDLLAEECDSEHVASIERAHDRMDGLIENLLTLAQNKERVTERDPVDIETVTEQCWATVETTDATLTVDSDRTVRADESRLKQVFENLFRNAVEHGSTDSQPEAEDGVGHGEGGVAITVGDLPGGFYVEDDGPGIPAEYREEVFEVGYSTNDEGTGFGLSIVEQIATAHDWAVEVTDATSGGARIEITGVEFVE